MLASSQTLKFNTLILALKKIAKSYFQNAN